MVHTLPKQLARLTNHYLRMNLYLFNDNDSAAVFGIGTYINELTSTLAGTGINMHIVHLHSTRLKFEIEKTNQIEHWYFPEVRNQNTFAGNIEMLEAYCRNIVYLFRIYIKDTKDLIFHFNFNQYQLLAKALKTVFECKTVMTVHFSNRLLALGSNHSLFNIIKSKPENQRNAFEKLLIKTDEYERMLYHQTDHIIALCKYMQNLLQSEYQIESDKISVIQNGLSIIDTGGRKSYNKEILRKKWHFHKKENLILFAGRLQPVKGILYLIRAFRKVIKEIPDCRLLIAGSGEFNYYLNECEDIWTYITWTGLLDKCALNELYSIADIGIMPSFHEQCSFVAIEMMKHGLPIIGSTTTGLKEMILDGETGLHIPVIESKDKTEIDATLLAEKILFLLNNPIERERMGQNARRNYKNLYNKDLFQNKMLSLYDSLLKMKP